MNQQLREAMSQIKIVGRRGGRAPKDLRPIRLTRNYLRYPEGSVLVEFGETKVICTASVEERVPPFLKGKGEGWVTAEYAMLPRATAERTPRDAARGRIGGRTHEIQRLVGRALRAVVEMAKLGERTIWIDCDVIQADGGTRTASITGSFVALADALQHLVSTGKIPAPPIRDLVAAVSVGVVQGDVLLDLDYFEDSSAEVDMNVVMTGAGAYVEVQGTAEQTPFSHDRLQTMLHLAEEGIRRLHGLQRRALSERNELVFTL